MPTTTLTFPNDINVSVQIGDIIYYSPTTTIGTHNTAGTVVELGYVIQKTRQKWTLYPWTSRRVVNNL